MPHFDMQHDVDPREDLLARLGDISNFKIFYNQVLVAVYLRPEKTKGGIVLPDQHLSEDKHQSKVGLVVAMGDRAFVNDEKWNFDGINVKLHDWIVFRPSDGWQVTVNKVLCRVLDDSIIKGTVDHPDRVW